MMAVWVIRRSIVVEDGKKCWGICLSRSYWAMTHKVRNNGRIALARVEAENLSTALKEKRNCLGTQFLLSG